MEEDESWEVVGMDFVQILLADAFTAILILLIFELFVAGFDEPEAEEQPLDVELFEGEELAAALDFEGGGAQAEEGVWDDFFENDSEEDFDDGFSLGESDVLEVGDQPDEILFWDGEEVEEWRSLIVHEVAADEVVEHEGLKQVLSLFE